MCPVSGRSPSFAITHHTAGKADVCLQYPPPASARRSRMPSGRISASRLVALAGGQNRSGANAARSARHDPGHLPARGEFPASPRKVSAVTADGSRLTDTYHRKTIGNSPAGSKSPRRPRKLSATASPPQQINRPGHQSRPRTRQPAETRRPTTRPPGQPTAPSPARLNTR